MDNKLYPYQTFFEDLKLTVKHPQLERDGRHQELPAEDFIEDAKQILLWPNDNVVWKNLVLSVEVEAPETDVFLMDINKNELFLTAVAQSTQSQVRRAVRLNRIGESNTWKGQIELPRELFKGKTTFSCFAAGRPLNTEDSTGIRSFRWLGETESWTLYFEEVRSKLPKGELQVLWVDFTSSQDHPDLYKYRSEMFYLDMNSDQAEPVVYLNSAFDNLKALFNERPKPTGSRLALHESVRTSVAKSVWLAMFQSALGGIVHGEAGEPAGWPSGWKEVVLKLILPKVYPDLEENEALQAAEEARRSNNAGPLESAALAVIASDILNEGKLLRKAVRLILEE